jgi:hypothetical protein
MTADERLALVCQKIERADKHVSDLNAAIEAFYSTNPYEVGIKHNGQTGKLVHYMVRVDPVPAHIVMVTGDVLNNLRSALDHLAQQLYLVGSGSTTSTSKTSFPITETREVFEKIFKSKVDGMKADAKDAIRAVEPYGGGKGDALWRLHQLNNIDKHRIILTAWSTMRSMDMGAKIVRDLNPMLPDWAKIAPFDFFLKPANKTELKVGDVIAGADQIEQHDKRRFIFEIAIYEPGLSRVSR